MKQEKGIRIRRSLNNILERTDETTCLAESDEDLKKAHNSRKKYPQYGSLDLRRECRRGNGRCKVKCHEKKIRIAYCMRPATHCCL
ncbi:beta-defensin 110-like [Rhynchocyon petersi]